MLKATHTYCMWVGERESKQRTFGKIREGMCRQVVPHEKEQS